MFGANDTDEQTATMGPPSVQDPSMLDNVQPPTPVPTVPPVAPSAQVPSAPAPVEHPLTTDNPFIQNPITVPSVSSSPAVSTPPASVFSTDTQADSSMTDMPKLNAESAHDSTDSALPTTPPAVLTPLQPVNTDHLASMKQEALGHLEPLVDHLDQSPEEEFNTLLTMIRANDNHTLLERALTAAKKIEDDKARAEAMLDIVNEINYFSSQS